MAALPLGVSPDNGFDMRDPADYPRQVRFAAWDGDTRSSSSASRIG